MAARIFRRTLLSLLFALVFGLLPGVFKAQAVEIWEGPPTEDCQTCHPIVQEFWGNGSHGAAGVDCATCHYPYTDHPEDIMPTDVSSRLCGQCHIDTMEEWATSVHGQEDLTCVRCHNSHTTHLKTEDVHSLCQHCHSERVHYYSLSDHAQHGLLCIDCHLQVSPNEVRNGPGNRVHTFAVDLHSCMTCHENDLHDPQQTDICDPEKRAEAEQLGVVFPCEEPEVAQAAMGIPLEEGVLMVEPHDTSPVGFAIIGTLIGLAAGMILAPWLEKWYRQNRM